MTQRRSRLGRGLTRRDFTLGAPTLPMVTAAQCEVGKAAGLRAIWVAWLAARKALDNPLDGEIEQQSADDRLQELTAALIALPALDIGDVAIKLSALVAMAPILRGDDQEFPWPELRAILQDLHRGG